ncbi:DUF3883 domain-containing protein [Planctomycetota bacterium]|nr:DUF3883 domain-containing protein [Planctomycetota bacterium]
MSDDLSEALSDLSFIQWIPIKKEASGFLCFSQPDEALASPDEVYFAKFGNLIASQSPIAQFAKEPNDRVKEAMGFPEKPMLRQVRFHFEKVLEEYSMDGTLSEADQSKLEKGLDSIYEYFGKQIDFSGKKDPFLARRDKENLRSLELSKEPGNLLCFSDVPCIWDSAAKRFWRPDQVFSENVKYMEPWRRTITSKDALIERGYESLGRKKTPDINDWKQVLAEIAESDQSLEENDNPQIIKTVIYHIVTELMETESVDSNVFVPTRKGTMEPSRNLYMPDGFWDGDTLDSWDIPILSGSISNIEGIQSALGIPRLRDSIVSRLIGEPVASEEESERLECERLEGLLRSSEFIRGMQRLCQNEFGDMYDTDLSFLDSIQVQIVKAITIGRYFAEGSNELLLDEASQKFYWDAGNSRALLSENFGRNAGHRLAKILAGAIEGCLLQETVPIYEMLKCKDPAEICEVLNEFEIPDTEIVEAWRPEIDEEVEGRDTAEASTEVEEQEVNEEGSAEYPDSDGVDENPELIPVPDIDDDQRLSSDENEPEGWAQSEEDSSYPEQPAKSDQSEHPREVSTASRRRKSDTSQGEESSETARSRGGSQEHVSTGTGPNQTSKSEGGSGTEKDDVLGEIADAASGSTAGRSQSSNQSRLGSYVSQKDGNGELSESTEDQQRRIKEVDAGAVSFVLEHEKEQGRIATEMPHENEGYDVKSVDGNQTRYIEVKGTEKPWGKTGVALTKKQFAYTQKYPDRDFWLYVVENVSSNPQLHKIQDPAGKVDRYFFDVGWRQVAVDTPGMENSNELGAPGDAVFVGDSKVGEVEQIVKSGKLPLVIYKDNDGKQQRKLLSEVDIRPTEA